MFLSGTTGSAEGGALRRRAHQSGSDRARRARPSKTRVDRELSSSWNSIILPVTNAAYNSDRR